MWEKFTERSRRIIYKAQEEAHRYGHPNVGTEHLVLGILDEPDSAAARVLATLGEGLERVRVQIVAAMPPGAKGSGESLGFTSDARRAVELAQEEATQAGADHIGSGHLLLGLLRCREGEGGHVLEQSGIHLTAVRDELQADEAGQHAEARGEDQRVQEHETVKSLPPLVRGALGHSWDHLSYRARAAVDAALSSAAERGDTLVTPLHLLLGIVQDGAGSAARALARLNVPVVDLRTELENGLPRHGDARSTDRELELRTATRNAVAQAELSARSDGDSQITTARLLMGILADANSRAAALLINKGMDLGALRVIVAEQKGEDEGRPPVKMEQLANLTVSQLIVRSQLKGRSVLRVSDLSPADVAIIFAVAEKLKARRVSGRVRDETAVMHQGKTLAMVFQKPSLRTRVTFEIGMTQLGGHAIHLGPDEIGVGERESPADVARNLERWVNGIVARTFTHKMIEDLAANCAIPVINGLSDFEHPCQALADLFTLLERYGRLAGLTLAYVGDSNNVARSLAELCARTGVNMRIAAPEGYQFDDAFIRGVNVTANSTGAKIEMLTDPKAAAKDADAVYTDVWASMGQEAETKKRHDDFQGYQLNTELLSVARPNAAVMHCQPAHRGEEISGDAMDSPNSVIFDEAENRLHVQKALLALTL